MMFIVIAIVGISAAIVIAEASGVHEKYEES